MDCKIISGLAFGTWLGATQRRTTTHSVLLVGSCARRDCRSALVTTRTMSRHIEKVHVQHLLKHHVAMVCRQAWRSTRCVAAFQAKWLTVLFALLGLRGPKATLALCGDAETGPLQGQGCKLVPGERAQLRFHALLRNATSQRVGLFRAVAPFNKRRTLVASCTHRADMEARDLLGFLVHNIPIFDAFTRRYTGTKVATLKSVGLTISQALPGSWKANSILALHGDAEFRQVQ
mmetsp:Transcript_39827/g.92188  ORF Transcript_39827/g.92188 Transcript_39827/m.92188 type:complete len:233 (-) Transcript_39827:769-1467(-)